MSFTCKRSKNCNTKVKHGKSESVRKKFQGVGEYKSYSIKDLNKLTPQLTKTTEDAKEKLYTVIEEN